MEKTTVYLGGPIAGCTFEEIRERRNFLKNRLQESYTFLDPVERGLFADGRNSADVVEGDKEMILAADMVFIDAWKTSVGTCMEMMYASINRKTIVVLLPDDNSEINPWYSYHADYVCRGSIDTMFEFFMTRSLWRIASPITITTDQGLVNVSDELLNQSSMLDTLCRTVHRANEKWWVNPHTGEKIHRNFGEMLMLTVSELGEAIDGHRRNKADDHLPGFPNVQVEVVDAFIRLMDIFAGMNMNPRIWAYKMAYNAARADHKLENRVKEGGKAY